MLEDVLAANAAFYEAFERRSVEAMGLVWDHSQRVVCVHPGWPMLRGWPVVEESGRRMFDGPGHQFIVTNDTVEGSPASSPSGTSVRRRRSPLASLRRDRASRTAPGILSSATSRRCGRCSNG